MIADILKVTFEMDMHLESMTKISLMIFKDKV